MTKDELIALARKKADEHQLSQELVCAVIEQESRWNPWAINAEPDYVYLWDLGRNRPFRKITPEERRSEKPPGDFTAPTHVDRDAEWWSQQISWGVMQVMGGVAREVGFKGSFLTELCDPEVGIELGCRALARKLAVAEGNVVKALLLWNGGGNKAYPGEVLARVSNYKSS